MGTGIYECHQSTGCTIGEHFRSSDHGQHSMNFPHNRHIVEARVRFGNIEALYLLSVLNVPLKDSYEEEIKIMEK